MKETDKKVARIKKLTSKLKTRLQKNWTPDSMSDRDVAHIVAIVREAVALVIAVEALHD